MKHRVYSLEWWNDEDEFMARELNKLLTPGERVVAMSFTKAGNKMVVITIDPSIPVNHGLNNDDPRGKNKK